MKANKRIDLKVLKSKHRLELIMQEAGERFEADPNNKDIWRSIDKSGLTVDIKHQRFEISKPGIEPESGDVYAWLKQRYGWSFNQAIRYLQNRPLDPKQAQEPQSAPVKQESNHTSVNLQSSSRYSSEFRDERKEQSGLFDTCVVARGESISYQYLLRPSDALQKRALELGGEEMRDCFTMNSSDLKTLRDLEPAHFIPFQDADIEVCDECESTIKWFWKEKPSFTHQEIFIPNSIAPGFKMVETPQVYAYEYEVEGEIFYICKNCKRQKLYRREALNLLYQSALQRERQAYAITTGV